jgi:hypothetical protein
MELIRDFTYQLRWMAQTFFALVEKVVPSDRLLHPYPRLSQTKFRHSPQRINGILRSISGPVSYLEVGIEKGWTLQSVAAKRRIGVDPNPRFSQEFLPSGVEVFQGTSDEFFAENEHEFSLIFLDGFHEATQTYRDFCNATKFLSLGGAILIDDVFPTDEYSANPVEGLAEELKKENGIEHRAWYGDVWKVVPTILQFHGAWKVVILGGTDGTHGQALVCRTGEDARSAHVSAEAIEAIGRMTFEDYFSGEHSLLATLAVSAKLFLQPASLRSWLSSQ